MKRTTLLLCAVTALVAATAAPAATTTVVMSGLDNPRGLAFGLGGILSVAEAGRGGAGPCVVMRGRPQCYGPTGAVSALIVHRQFRLVRGLPSTIAPDGEVTGPHDLTLDRGGIDVVVGWGGDPALRAQLGEAGRLFGHLVDASALVPFSIADIAAVEAASNPDDGPVDSNPYGVHWLISHLGSPETFVADAGGNTLIRISGGVAAAVRVFPSRPGRPVDSVPTEVTRGPDGALYVGELTGGPFPDGAAIIWRLTPGAPMQAWSTGWKTIIDLDWGMDGSLYVLQYASGPIGLAPPGQLWRLAPDGTRTLITDALVNPTAVEVGPDGALYVSNKGNLVGVGEVLRIAP